MNKQIIGAVIIIGGTGVVTSWTAKKPITPVILGSYVLLLVLSIMDLFGGPIRKLAGAIAMVAVLFVLLNEFPWDQINSLLNKKSS
jgi:hypothetical protein